MEGIKVQLYPCYIADDLEDQARGHDAKEGPCTMADTKVYLDGDQDREYGEIERVTA
jgi:hypothetical protein